MAKKFFIGSIHEKTFSAHMSASGKAFYTSYDHGYCGRGHESIEWIPCKACEFGEPNDIGWLQVKVPACVFTNKGIDHRRCTDIQWQGVEIH